MIWYEVLYSILPANILGYTLDIISCNYLMLVELKDYDKIWLQIWL